MWVLPLIAIGLGIVVVRKMTEKKPPSPSPKPTPPAGPSKFLPNNRSDWTGWVWPVPHFQGREPVISHGFVAGERYLSNGTINKAAHMGVDIMFKRVATDPTTPASDVAIPKGGKNPGWIATRGTPIVAAGPGQVWRAGNSPRGMWIQIDHGVVGKAGGINTYYQHLDSFAKPWKKGDQVLAGTLLGTMGGDPSTVQKLRHLHFELWKPVAGQDNDDWPKDPAAVMKHWTKLQGA